MKILIYIEHVAGQIAALNAELMTLARDLADKSSGSVEAVVVGAETAAIATALQHADVVLSVQDKALANYNQPGHASALESAILARKPDLVLFGYTSSGLDLAPYLAARLNLSYACYCKDLRVADGGLSTTCQIYGGKLEAEVELSGPSIVVVAPGAFREKNLAKRKAEIIQLKFVPPSGQVEFVSASELDPNAVDITKASKLLCVGRGIGEKANIDEAQDLATVLGAELVSSRPLVDAGWFPKERQVGKSGRKVKPKLYLAIGVSGAPEHLEGMAASDVIIAVNKDPKAPIFQVAHYGVVGDALDFVSALQKALKAG
jgi:electron transfer flavoprotein alpha subunit